MKLAEIQAKLKVPKSQTNAFGKYKYRSCEDIIEAVKPIINPLGFHLILTDQIVMIGNRYYVESIATLSDGKEMYTAKGYAREDEASKGRDGSQTTGSSSSYSRKYALNGLFAIDDTKDSDATNQGDKEDKSKTTKPLFDETHPNFNIAKTMLSDGTTTIENIQKKYTLTQYIIDKLITK